MLEKEAYHPDLKILDWTLEWNTNQLGFTCMDSDRKTRIATVA